MADGPIFIIGPMGTGTTLLRLMLDSHERIAIPKETGFMRSEHALRFVPFKWTGGRWYRRLGWSDEEFNDLLRSFFDQIFRRYADEHGKARWGEKTPLHTWHVTRMMKLFPDARFIATVRHPGAAVASNMKRWDHSLPKAAYHYARYGTESARLTQRRRKRVAMVRYEDLVTNPEQLMRELLAWLGEDWSDAVLQHHQVQPKRESEFKVEGKVNAADSIDPSRIAKWTQAFDDDQRAELASTVGPLAQLLGYDMDDPATIAPMRADGKLLIRGRHIAARAQKIPGVDLSERFPIPFYERRYHPRHLTLKAVEPPVELPGPRWLRPVVARLPQGARARIAAGGPAAEDEP